jgi:hypothetical protein
MMSKISLNEILLLKQALLAKIKLLGETMIDFGMREGLTHEKTINLSQELDQYIFLYQKLKGYSQKYAAE